MGGDGNPDPAAKRCGEAIARLRTQRGWSRSSLVRALFDVLDAEDTLRDDISESWLGRIEDGRTVKIYRHTIEAICQALKCTPPERWYVLQAADRNVLADPKGFVGGSSEVLARAIACIYEQPKSIALIEKALRTRKASDLTRRELFELTISALNEMSTTYIVRLTRPVLQVALESYCFRPGALRGEESAEYVLCDEGSQARELTIACKRQSDEAWQIIVNSTPPRKEWITVDLSELTIRSRVNEQGIATIAGIPDDLFNQPTGPDLEIRIEADE